MANDAIDARLKEKLEILAGDRPRNQKDAAVRFSDLDKILNELESRILETLRREMSP